MDDRQNMRDVQALDAEKQRCNGESRVCNMCAKRAVEVLAATKRLWQICERRKRNKRSAGEVL